jgi:hypothetical protein
VETQRDEGRSYLTKQHHHHTEKKTHSNDFTITHDGHKTDPAICIRGIKGWRQHAKSGGADRPASNVAKGGGPCSRTRHEHCTAPDHLGKGWDVLIDGGRLLSRSYEEGDGCARGGIWTKAHASLEGQGRWSARYGGGIGIGGCAR